MSDRKDAADHTPALPFTDAGWIGTMGCGSIADATGRDVAHVNDNALRAFIVRAVNNHEALLAALKEAEGFMVMKWIHECGAFGWPSDVALKKLAENDAHPVHALRAAIASAEGTEKGATP